MAVAVEENTVRVTNKNVETFSSEPVLEEQEEQEDEQEQEQGQENGDEGGTLRNEKLKKLGMLCVSLGLQPQRMTDKMMSTIKRSKDIEKDQRNVISKLSSASSIRNKDGAEEDYDEDDDDDDDDDNDNDDNDDEDVVMEGEEVVVVGESTESVVQTNQDKTIDGEATDKESELNTKSGKSLKRKKIPPPLNLSETSRPGSTNNSSGNNSATSTCYARDNLGAKSAPANVPKFPRSTTQGKFPFIGKPRVQYLGKVSNVISRQQPNQLNGYKLKTPYVPYFPRGPPFPPPAPPPSMPAYPYYPYAYPGQFSLYQTPQQPYGPPPFMVSASSNPRSAMPYSSQAQYYQEADLNGKRSKVKRQQHQQVKKPKVQDTADYVTEDLRGKEKDAGTGETEDDSHKEDRESEQRHISANDEECESAHLAIENGAAFSPSMNSSPNTVLGEIRILRNVFSFEFPVNSSTVDKKMFMSICDKVWDESKGLDKGYRL